jgi:hypothetical protein
VKTVARSAIQANVVIFLLNAKRSKDDAGLKPIGTSISLGFFGLDFKTDVGTRRGTFWCSFFG